MRSGKTTLFILTGVFLLSEIKINYFIALEDSNSFFVLVVKTFIFLLFIFLFSKGLKWAKWTLSVMLALYGLLFLLASLEFGLTYFFIGTYDLFFGLSIHWLNNLKNLTWQDSSVITTEEVDDDVQETIPKISDFQYPSLVKRYKSLLIDGLLQLTILIIIMVLVNDSEMRTTVMVSSGLLLVALYEPLLTVYQKRLVSE